MLTKKQPKGASAAEVGGPFSETLRSLSALWQDAWRLSRSQLSVSSPGVSLCFGLEGLEAAQPGQSTPRSRVPLQVEG